jgi:hypothetical protein
MITKHHAMTLGMFYHKTLRNKDGSAVRCRANGRCKVWKTRPEDFRLPVKYGLKQCFYLTPRNAEEWLWFDLTGYAKELELPSDAPWFVVHDMALERGMIL